MAITTFTTFTPCCTDLIVLQFIGTLPNNYYTNQTVIYNNTCYTVTVVSTAGFGPTRPSTEPAFGGPATGGPYAPDTAYEINETKDCSNILCPECIAYNFVNCDDETLIFQGYLSNPENIPYFPYAVELESTPYDIGTYINCWTITELVEINVPLSTFTMTLGYTDCPKCLSAKNVPPCISLTNCITGEVILISSADSLIDFLGKIIKIEITTETGIEIVCYEVALSQLCPEEPTSLPGPIIDCFTKCEDCVPKCSCTRAVNGGNIAKRLEYKDCDGLIQLTEEIVGAGQRSKKYCTLEWTDEDVVEVINFGDCIDNACPEIPLPKRVVTPGYNTPICTPAQYERIVCRYAEIKYKEVLSKRYGIEDCCDDESLANDIKYELIHLQMLEDPEYVCVNNPRLCPPGCGYINMNIIHECPPQEPELYQYRLTVSGAPNPAAGSLLSYIDENGLPINPLITIALSKTGYELIFCAEYGSITLNGTPYYAANEPCPTPPCVSFGGLILERVGDC